MIKNYHIVKDIKLKAKSFTMSCLEYPFLNKSIYLPSICEKIDILRNAYFFID